MPGGGKSPAGHILQAELQHMPELFGALPGDFVSAAYPGGGVKLLHLLLQYVPAAEIFRCCREFLFDAEAVRYGSGSDEILRSQSAADICFAAPHLIEFIAAPGERAVSAP